MKLLFESWRQFLTEDVYPPDVRKFIRFAKKTERIEDPQERTKVLKSFLDRQFKIYGAPSKGAFRRTYLVGGYIIKLAEKGTERNLNLPDQEPASEQNKQEVEMFLQDRIDIFPDMMAYDKKDYLWYVAERVEVMVNHHSDEEVMKNLYPKFYEMMKGWGIKSDTGRAVRFGITDLLRFEDKKTTISTYKRSEDLVDLLLNVVRYPARYVRKKWEPEKVMRVAKKHKEQLDELYSYLKNPDENYVKLRKAIREYNVDIHDLHDGNIGFDEDYNIKIIDAAFSSHYHKNKYK